MSWGKLGIYCYKGKKKKKKYKLEEMRTNTAPAEQHS